MSATDLAVDLDDALEVRSVERVGPRGDGYRRGALVRRGCCSSPMSRASCSLSSSRTLLVPSAGRSADRVSPGYEYLAFLLAIPGWVLLLRLEGLYDRDEERTDHSTVDDIVGVVPQRHDRRLDLRPLRRRDEPRAAGARPARRLLARRGRPDPDPARDRADALPPPARLRAERRHRRRGARRPAARAQADEPSRVRHQPRGVRRRSSHRARRRARATASVALGRPGPAARMCRWSTGSSA